MKVATFCGVSLALAIAGCSTSEGSNADDGSGSGATGGSGGVVDGGGGVGGGGFDACAGDIYDGQLIPLDMMILMDRSGSMEDKVAAGSATDRWTATTGALRDFVKADLGGEVSVGVQFFPLDFEGPIPVPDMVVNGCEMGSDDCGPYSNCQDATFFTHCSPIIDKPQMTCEPQDYIDVAVPITKLPAGVGAIEGALATTLPAGGTPMAPAMHGAMSYLIQHATANPERLHVMVLASDGDPSGCGTTNNAEGVGEIAKRGLDNTPEIKTFVIGIGLTSKLNLIAYQGGTTEATLVEGDDTGEKFLERLNEIRGELVDCRYTIPVPDTGSPNYDEVNFKYSNEGGDETWLKRVNSEADCPDDGLGWYYDDNASPTLMHMCSKMCESMEIQGGTVEIEIGCPPRIN